MSQARFDSVRNVLELNDEQQHEPLSHSQMYHGRQNHKTNEQVNIQPVQRIDSFNTATSSHELTSTFSTESSFNFDHPTPIDSGDEHTFHTPDIADLLWQENFNDKGAANENNYHTQYDEDMYRDMNRQARSTGLASHKNSLPSPQSTNISTPEASGHTKNLSQSSAIFTSPTSVPQQLKRSLDTELAAYQSSGSEMHLYTPVQGSAHVTSPAIVLSSHTRGDSPARSDGGQQRVSKKRSASNLSQGEYFPDMKESSHASGLMPPQADMDWVEEDGQREGIDPADRGVQEHPSFNDLENQHEQDKTVNEVQTWLRDTSLNPASARHARGHVRPEVRPDRIRSRSTGARPQAGQRPILKNNKAPGPGVLIEEESDWYYSSDDEESNYSLQADEQPETQPTTMPPRRVSEVAPDEITPLPAGFHRASPWQDAAPVQPPSDDTRMQPDSSEAAIYKFNQRAKEFDTLSRSATWGTGRRRLSDGDMDSLSGDIGKTRHLSLTKSRMRERGTSILQNVKAKATELKRSTSRNKHSQQPSMAELEKVQSPEPIEDRSSTESHTHPSHGSHPKPKSPSISAALWGVTGSAAAVGAGATSLNIETEHHPEGFIKRTMRRVRSRSDVNKSPKSPSGYQSLIAHEGGMPHPILASPGHEEPAPLLQSLQPVNTHQVPSLHSPSPVRMPLSPRPANVMPNLEGFKIQILELNPSLAPYLVERIAHDQVRRYKRLVKNRVDHIAAFADGTCKSGILCASAGGEAEILPTRAGGREAIAASSQFKITPGLDSDNEDSPFDGVVTPAAFPDGIPLPPTKKLPAKFECQLCFQVKTFQKPSDWTKHVHEDVQPFTCTFPTCSEPKSFKRKADWVRHENERHRHLEWWKCNLSECTHICYRKDNFVQHLVREHKRKEPKIKGRSQGGSKNKGKGATNGFNQEELEFWNLVDECRHEGAADARQEPCKFCGNVCTSWKKLSVHVGKHMEQIAMPVLDLAQRRNVTKDTIISPVEPLPNRNGPFLGPEQGIMDFQNALSPFSQSGPSYHSSSAEQSPAVMHPRLHNRIGVGHGGFLPHSSSYSSALRPPTMNAPYAYGISNSDSGFPPYVGYDGVQYGSHNGQHVMYTQHNQMSHPESIPRSTAAETSYSEMHSTYEDQSPYYASPEQQYLHYHTPGIMRQGQISTPIQMQTHLQTPITTQGMGDGYMYAQQQQWQHQ